MAKTPPLTPHDHAEHIAESTVSLDKLNEADTRHQIIDSIIHDVLCWPKSSVRCETYIEPGYADYVLLGRRDRQLLFIEAKKTGYYFQLPPSYLSTELSRLIAVKTLMTDGEIAKAINQVRAYCLDTGCEYAAVTNGRQWIFFKTFARNQDWKTLKAFVIEDIRFFSKMFSRASSLLSYTSITVDASLASLFGEAQAGNRPRYYPKEKITAYDHEVTANHLAPSMRPIIERYFGKMNAFDSDFMDKCYVNNREYEISENGVKQLIHDSLSPYFRDYNVKEFFDNKGGGAFGSRISSSARERRTRDVIVLFGGKGSGKSTFTNRLLYHRPPRPIQYFTRVAIIDLLECPETQQRIEEEAWSQLIKELDSEKILNESRDELLKLFANRYEIALKQSLAGLSLKSEGFNLRLNLLLEEWKKDKPYCASQLADYWKTRQKGVIVVLDNTDQFSPLNQDFCFTLAHNMSTSMDCLVVISMREERFHYSKIHGTLDAFQNSGFHLSSPDPAKLFRLRLKYVLEILGVPDRVRKVAPELSDTQIEDVKQLAKIFLKEFQREDSHLNRFVQACAHGNMRLALDFFRQFVLSGYLQVDEMISKRRYTLQVHQVLRPMMVPYRLFYDERRSSVPNIFQVRSEENGSHFTGLRILDILSIGSAFTNPEYVPLSRIRAYFAETFNMLDDAEKTMDVLLKGGMIESNNRVDEYIDSIDSLKITAYGLYVAGSLAANFSYLDLVCLDCGVHDQGVADSLATLGNRDRDFFLEHRKRERLDARLDKVRIFLEYLKREEDTERELYELEGERRFIPGLIEQYLLDEQRVVRSAKNNHKYPKNAGG